MCFCACVQASVESIDARRLASSSSQRILIYSLRRPPTRTHTIGSKNLCKDQHNNAHSRTCMLYRYSVCVCGMYVMLRGNSTPMYTHTRCTRRTRCLGTRIYPYSANTTDVEWRLNAKPREARAESWGCVCFCVRCEHELTAFKSRLIAEQLRVCCWFHTLCRFQWPMANVAAMFSAKTLGLKIIKLNMLVKFSFDI